MLHHSSNDPHCSSDEHSVFLRLCRKGDVGTAVTCMIDHLELGTEKPDRQLDLVKALLA